MQGGTFALCLLMGANKSLGQARRSLIHPPTKPQFRTCEKPKSFVVPFPSLHVGALPAQSFCLIFLAHTHHGARRAVDGQLQGWARELPPRCQGCCAHAAPAGKVEGHELGEPTQSLMESISQINQCAHLKSELPPRVAVPPHLFRRCTLLSTNVKERKTRGACASSAHTQDQPAASARRCPPPPAQPLRLVEHKRSRLLLQDVCACRDEQEIGAKRGPDVERPALTPAPCADTWWNARWVSNTDPHHINPNPAHQSIGGHCACTGRAWCSSQPSQGSTVSNRSQNPPAPIALAATSCRSGPWLMPPMLCMDSRPCPSVSK